MSYDAFQRWSPLCLLLRDKANDTLVQGTELSSNEVFLVGNVSQETKHTKRWSTGPSFVKHCELLKRHSLPAVRSSSTGHHFLQQLQSKESFTTPPTVELEDHTKSPRVLDEFMEDDDSLFDSESPSLCAKTNLKELVSSHPLLKAQSPPSDITQSILSSTQSPVPSLLSETELPDFGEDFVNVEEELYSADDWNYFQVGEFLLSNWRRCLRNHNERFSCDFMDNEWKLVDIRYLSVD